MFSKFIDELTWRGLIQDKIEGIEEHLAAKMVTGYIGFDPTASSLHVGSLLPIMVLVRFQRAGHKPIVILGGGTGMIGDPSGKTTERQLLNQETLEKNVQALQKQLSQYLNFEEGQNKAELLNNIDWLGKISMIEFLREVGKFFRVNVMLTKDSVKKRIESEVGISYTEFSYQLLQAYDFEYLYRNKACTLQMGASDQWGNITAGTDYIHYKHGHQAKVFGLTFPLVTKSDGTKFGKSEKGNIWLDPALTTPYQFYQFWLRTPDESAAKFLRYYTLLDKSTIEELESEHAQAPHLRIVQNALADEITSFVHGKDALNLAKRTTQALFSKNIQEAFTGLSDEEINLVLSGADSVTIPKTQLEVGIPILDAIVISGLKESKGEARKLIQGNGFSVNKVKWTQTNGLLTQEYLLQNKFILLQSGRSDIVVLKVE
ncbi:MAG: tyrosine--tRNA ligase [Bacteroidia bacterium]|nr:tyrosine--tRNA ligase [Bacteroidia bacterium]MDW8347958.1 tyrosine--tRNA ligase [Bacteroidia bacterium]